MRRFLLALIGLFAMSTAPVLAASAPPLEAYGRLPAIEYVSLSPSGGRLLSVGEVNGKRLMSEAEAAIGRIAALTRVTA